MATALKIVLSDSTEVLFDEEEYKIVNVEYPQECKVHESISRLPTLHDVRMSLINYDATKVEQLYDFTIEFLHKWTTTEAKIVSLIADSGVMNMYLNYLESPTAYIPAVIDPNWNQDLAFGDKVVKKTTVNFNGAKYDASNVYVDYAGKVALDIIFDPDGDRIKLDGLFDIVNMTPIECGVNLDPTLVRQFQLNDLYITLNDSINYFNVPRIISDPKAYPFHTDITGILAINTGTKTVYPYAAHNDGGSGTAYNRYKAGDRVTLMQAATPTVSETVTVATAGTVEYGGYTRAYFTYSETLSNVYAQYDLIYKYPVIGSRLDVNLRITKEDGSIISYNLFAGVIREPFTWNNGQAVIKVDNILGEYFQKELRIHAASSNPTQRYNTVGALASTLDWTVKTGSGTLSGVTVYTGAILGEWVITFSDATNFTVTGPNTDAKAGTTAGDFYDQTDATDSQIKIPSANWGGTPAADDVLSFFVSANLVGRVEQIFHELLVSYGGIPATWLGDDFDNAFTSDVYTLSFDSIGTIGDAITAVGVHGMAWLYQTIDNTLRIFYFRVDDVTGESVVADYTLVLNNSFSYNRMDIYNTFNIFYAYDYENGVYQKSLTYPLSDALNKSYQVFDKKRAIDLYMPGQYSDSDALAWIKKWYNIYAYGLETYRFDIDPLKQNDAEAITWGDYLGYADTGFAALDYMPISTFRVQFLFDKSAKIRLYGYKQQEDWENVW